MLIRLFGENFRSLRDPFELSFVAADLPSERDRGFSIIHPKGDGEPLRVLRCLAVFGANASGKSTVLEAAGALRWMIRESSRQLEPKKRIPPYEPFAFSATARESPVSLGCTIFHAGLFYEYELRYSANRIDSERLVRLDAPDEPLLIRESTLTVGGQLVEGNEQIKALVSQPRSNTPVFSLLAQHGPEAGEASVLPLWRAFHDRLRHRDYSQMGLAFALYDQTAKRLHTDSGFRTWVLSRLIRPADLGIRDLRTEEVDFPAILKSAPEDLRKQLADDAPFYQTEFIHHGQDVCLGLGQESAGTRKMYDLAADWWTLAHEPVTVFADELSASLHPLLLEHLVRAINEGSPQQETQSQLAFATHETELLETREGKAPALRRDQVYFTKKDETGASSLYSLAEFRDEARSVHNLRKRYLADRYGAIPRVEDLTL